MNLFRKAAALVLSCCTVLSCASCGENTANALNVSDYDVRAGIYLYYATSAFGEAINVIRDGGEDLEGVETSEDYKKILEKRDIDGVTAEQWIQNKAEEYCTTFVTIEKEFESLGLSLSGEELAAAESNAVSSMAAYGEFFTKTGIGEQSIKDILLNSYKQNAVWEAYYGKEGSKEIKDEDLFNFYKDNHYRYKYIEMPLKDGEGNLLKADGKKEIEDMANDYMKRLEKKVSKGEAALMNEFDFLISEHNNYVTSVSEAAVTTTDESGNTITTATTAKVTTDKYGNTDTTTAEETTTTAPPKDDDEDEEEETTVSGGTETTETTTTETTTTTTATSYDTFNEIINKISTSATQKEGEKETTTTEPTYTPCEKVYNFVSDPDTPLLKPELIKDEECYYIVCKMDIEERMTEDDLWTDSCIENTRSDEYYQEFLDMLDDLAKSMPVKRNNAAFRRYKVLDIDYVGYQQALMAAYSSMYGGAGY